jgi:hypothetical protein
VPYLVSRRCGLKVKSEERLAVPWDDLLSWTLTAKVQPVL